MTTYPKNKHEECETEERTFSGSLEEESHNEDLKSRHRYHQQTFHDAEVEDPPFCTAHGAEVAVLACSEVLLVAGDRG